MTAVFNVYEAKTQFSRLIQRVEAGEEIVIARNGTEVAKIVPLPRKVVREPGGWSHLPGWRDFTYDPAIFAPMTDEELREEGWE